jgi:hypothetical protein
MRAHISHPTRFRASTGRNSKNKSPYLILSTFRAVNQLTIFQHQHDRKIVYEHDSPCFGLHTSSSGRWLAKERLVMAGCVTDLQLCVK